VDGPSSSTHYITFPDYILRGGAGRHAPPIGSAVNSLSITRIWSGGGGGRRVTERIFEERAGTEENILQLGHPFSWRIGLKKFMEIK